MRLRAVAVENSVSRPVVYSDIDFNRHVNTLRFIDMIFDTMPLEEFEHRDAIRLDVNFLAEARYGEVISVGYIDDGAARSFEIASDSGKVLCRARVERKA